MPLIFRKWVNQVILKVAMLDGGIIRWEKGSIYEHANRHTYEKNEKSHYYQFHVLGHNEGELLNAAYRIILQ